VDKADKETVTRQTIKSRVEAVIDNMKNESLLRNYEEINRLENRIRWKEKMKRIKSNGEDNNVTGNSQSFDLNSSADWFVNFKLVDGSESGGNEAYSSLLMKNEGVENSDVMRQTKKMYDCPQ